MKKKVLLYRWLFALSALEGMVGLAAIFTVPSKQGAILLGFSPARWALGGGLLALLAPFVGICIWSMLDCAGFEARIQRFEQQLRQGQAYANLLTLLCAAALVGSMVMALRFAPLVPLPVLFKAVISRGFPLIAWLTLVTCQALAGMTWLYRREFSGQVRQTLLGVLVAFVFLTALSIHVGVVYSVLTAERPLIWGLHNDTIHRFGHGADFYALYHASLNIQENISPYRNNLDGVTPYFYPFRYLPLLAQAGQLLLWLPPESAYLAWALLLELLLAAMALILWRKIANRWLRLAALCILLLSSPFFLEIYLGQFTFATLCLMLLSFFLPAGFVFYALAVALKVFPLAAIPALVASRRFWPHFFAAVLGVVALSLPYFLAHPSDWQRFAEANASPYSGMHTGNFGPVYLVYMAFHDLQFAPVVENWPFIAATLRWGLLALTAGLVLGTRDKNPLLGAAALMLAHFTGYTDVWEHHMSGVILIGLVLLTQPRQERWFAPLVMMCVALLALPTPHTFFDTLKDPALFDPAGSWPRYASYLVPMTKAVPELVLYLACAALLLKSILWPECSATELDKSRGKK